MKRWIKLKKPYGWLREKSDKCSDLGWIEECQDPSNRGKYEIYKDYYFPVTEQVEETIKSMERTHGIEDYNAQPIFK